MNRHKTLLLLCIFSLSLTSCTVAKISGRGAVPFLLNQPAEQMELTEHIRVKKNSNFDWTSSFDVSELMAKKVAEKKPDAIINTTITVKTSIDNFFINLFTLGLARSRKIVVEADFMMDR
jgi:hypothetical protein